MKQKTESTRIVIVGAGLVGSTAAFAILAQGIAAEVILLDVNKNKAQGEALDMEHALSFFPEAKVRSGDYADCKDADIVVICGGIAQKPGQTRLDLTKTNVKIISDIVKNIKKYTTKAIILMVTNPLDVLTYTALKVSGYPKNQVFGTGTTLDSSRFRYLLAEKFKVDPHSMGAYLIGEHGDSEVPVFSHANVMGENIKSLPNYDKKSVDHAYKKTKNAAYEIIRKKGATYYAIAAAIARIARAILNDENHLFPVSSLLTGQHGIKNVCLSLPAVVGRAGIKQVMDIKLSGDELKKFKKSARVIRAALDEVGIK